MPDISPHSSAWQGRWLWVLWAAFLVRVVAQPLALILPLGSVPAFDDWHSGALPYPALLAAQLLILALLGAAAWRISTGRTKANRRWGVAFRWAGAVYLAAMVVRLLLGSTVLDGHSWFDAPLPTLFHFVLASACLVYGSFHAGAADEAGGSLAPRLIYPAVMVGVFVLWTVLQSAGASVMVSTYVVIVAAALTIAGLESRYPYRLDWRPPGSEVRTDFVFLAAVQLAGPPIIGFLFVYLLIEPVRSLELPLTALWPHGWPVGVQAVLMVLAVDFLRYWLHRWAHTSPALWRLHAVHHSVEQLYWLNTSRFHPLEKALQMLLDSVPFLLMGVDVRVLSLYYVAYATNGFFQHCNIRLEYGVLNYVVGSAETHRWHHSRVIGESNNNYGNTVIIWDLVFGTFFLPKARAINELGLLEPDYPKSFTGLLAAPFRKRRT